MQHPATFSWPVRWLGILVIAAALAGCAANAPLLNSERIEAAFGNYGIEVIEATDRKRSANLYSTKDGLRTTRTWAEVRFAFPVDAALREEHALVLAGGSIGEVFKTRGWRVVKHDIRIDWEMLTAADRAITAGMRVDAPVEVALHEYALVVEKNDRVIDYAVITERHHPAYLTVRDLVRIYGASPKSAK